MDCFRARFGFDVCYEKKLFSIICFEKAAVKKLKVVWKTVYMQIDHGAISSVMIGIIFIIIIFHTYR